MSRTTTNEILHHRVKRLLKTDTDPISITIKVVDEIGDDVPALVAALRQTLPEYVRTVQRKNKNSRVGPTPIYTPVPPTPHPVPKITIPAPPRPHSPKVANVRKFDWDKWRENLMEKQLFVGTPRRKFFRDCTATDFEFAALQNNSAIKKNQVWQKQNLALADLIRRHGKTTLSEIDTADIAEVWVPDV